MLNEQGEKQDGLCVLAIIVTFGVLQGIFQVSHPFHDHRLLFKRLEFPIEPEDLQQVGISIVVANLAFRKSSPYRSDLRLWHPLIDIPPKRFYRHLDLGNGEHGILNGTFLYLI